MRVIYCVYHRPQWMAAIKTLKQSHGWEPVYLFSDQDDPQSLRDSFPAVPIHNVWDAWRGIPARGLEQLDSRPVDAGQFAAFQCNIATFLAISSRADSRGSFLCRDQLRLFRRLIVYWLGVADSFKPDMVVFHDSPHSAWEYVLYLVCRELGVTTLFFQRTPLDGYSLVLDRIGGLPLALEVEDNRFDGSPAGEHLVRSDRNDNIDAYLDRLRGDYDEALPDYMKVQAERVRRHSLVTRASDWISSNLIRVLSRLPRVWRWPAYARLLLKPLALYIGNKGAVPWLGQRLKPPGRTYEGGSRMTYREWLSERRYARKYGEMLRGYYESLAIVPDLSSGPYVYAPLHYQPERTTAPDGGVFTDQWLMVNMLSKAVPASWRILVKEHPSQLSGDGDLEAYRVRACSDYDELLNLPNVKLVAQSVSSFDLLDNAVATATVTGTAGWESLVRGKPALVFGEAWYRWVAGAYQVNCLEDLQKALDSAVRHSAVDRSAVDEACDVIRQIGFRLDSRGGLSLPSGMSEDDNTAALTTALVRAAELSSVRRVIS